MPACSTIMDLSFHRFALTQYHLVERSKGLKRGARSLADSFVVDTSAGSSLIDSALDCAGSQTSSPRGPISRQCGRRTADLFCAYDVATSRLHVTAGRARKSHQTDGQHRDSDRNPSLGTATRFSFIIWMPQEVPLP